MKVVNHACTAALASALKSPTQFSNAAGPLDKIARLGVASEIVDQFVTFVIVQELAAGGQKFGISTTVTGVAPIVKTSPMD